MEYDWWADGDGLRCETLTFDSYEAAEAAGISFSEVEIAYTN